MKATEQAEQQLNTVQGKDAPVAAQIGACLRKRNLKLGEIVGKWGSLKRVDFRVSALGIPTRRSCRSASCRSAAVAAQPQPCRS